MGRFYGEIGFLFTDETRRGIYEERITRRNYYGDVVKSYNRVSPGEGLNDNLSLNNTISIVADNFAVENLGYMKYVKWRGTSWEIVSADDSSRPRIILTLGGVYNEPT